MRWLTAPTIAIAAALAISACGGSDSNVTPSGSDTVAARQVSGVGRVLVDQAGKPIYSSDQEETGRIVCDGACTAFWTPVKARGQMPTGDTAAGKLGVVKRPDGTRQVTADGRPLYTFSEDSPGKSTGDGFTDDFDGRHFTWHVVRAGGAPRTPTTKPSSGSGYGY